MKNLLLSALFASVSLASSAQATRPPRRAANARPAASVKVYVCEGSSAYAYHTSASCTGLGWCNHAISAVTVAKAKSMGRYPCGRCR